MKLAWPAGKAGQNDAEALTERSDAGEGVTMGSRLVATITVLGLAAGLPRAEAAVITEVSSFTGTTVFAVHGVDYATLIAATPFNSALGVLTGASVEFVGTAAPGVVFPNFLSPLPTSLTFTPGVALTASVSAPAGSPPSDGFPTARQTLASETVAVDANAGIFPLSVIGTLEAVDVTVSIPTDDLGNFAQSPVSVLNYNAVPLSGSYNPSITTDAEFITAFTYTPTASGGTAVPEPAFLSLGLLGIGAVGLALARRPRSLA